MALWEAMRDQHGMRWSEFTRRGGALQRGRDAAATLGLDRIPTAAEGPDERTFARLRRALREELEAREAAARAERETAARAERREEEALQRRLYEGPLPHFLLDRLHDVVPPAAHAERQREARRAQARDERAARDEPRQARCDASGAAGPSGVASPRAVLPRRQASREAAACQEGARPQKLARTAAAAAEEEDVDLDDDDDWVLLDTSPPDEIMETATAAGAASGLGRHIPRATW